MTHSKRKNARKTSRRWKPVGWIKSLQIFILQILQVCHINYEPLAYNETVEICRTPIVKVRKLVDSWKFEQVWENYLFFVNICWIWNCLVVATILALKKVYMYNIYMCSCSTATFGTPRIVTFPARLSARLFMKPNAPLSKRSPKSFLFSTRVRFLWCWLHSLSHLGH